MLQDIPQGKGREADVSFNSPNQLLEIHKGFSVAKQKQMKANMFP